jgi:peptide/nickel transport system permease protein
MSLLLARLARRPLALLGIALVILHLGIALIAPWVVPFDPERLLDAPLEAPNGIYWLGTDELGRDFLSRVVMGGRTAVLVAFVAGFLAALGGGVVGLIAAYCRGFVDDAISRVIDMKLAIPAILFVSLFVTGFGQSLLVLIVVITLIQMIGVIRTARSQGMTLMEQGFVKAAILRGESGAVILVRELLPNIADLLSVEFALRSSSALLLVSALSFLGLGISPPTPDWGLMIQEGLGSMQSEPWLIFVPALCISTLVVGINFATEGLADALGLEDARGTAGH